jgi:N-acetylmuramoyl-L-alanine amidase
MTPEQRITTFSLPFLFSRGCVGLAMLCAILLVGMVYAADPIRKPFEAGVAIAVKDGRILYLECQIPKRSARSAFLKRSLADESLRKPLQKLKTFNLAYEILTPQVQRRVIETLFPDDYADQAGWWHRVTYAQHPGFESWWNMSTWLTGRGRNYNFLEPIAENQDYFGTPRNGQVLFIPRDLLLDAFKTPSPARSGREPLIPSSQGDLRYGTDSEGEYAAYRIKQGETIHVNVIGRFTDLRGEAAVDGAVLRVLTRNKITDPKRVLAGQEIRVPLDMLARQYRPRTGSGLDGVVVILDPGHGGTDPGKEHGDVLEDEITYDLVVRIRAELERTTKARVHVTLLDPDQNDVPSSASRFTRDQDELILTTPNYNPVDTTKSVVLRMYLVNAIYREELARGTQPEKVLFASIHCDSLPAKLNGTMVYIPGAAHRGDVETPENPFYDGFKEAQGHRSITMTPAERQRDEGMSRAFAQTLVDTLQRQQRPIAVSSTGVPIRDVIIQSPTSKYIPGVIRNAKVPTRVLVETANVQNDYDRANLIDPQWRQAYAEAFVEAIRNHFDR